MTIRDIRPPEDIPRLLLYQSVLLLGITQDLLDLATLAAARNACWSMSRVLRGFLH